jgi:predicted secreted hydrolase
VAGGTSAPGPAAPGLSLPSILGAESGGFARAEAPAVLRFPADHGAHPQFRHEWWYFTGNLHTAGGRHFGYQLTFFRFALAPEAPQRASAWATNQVYMAHLALTDSRSGKFYAFERFSRDALGLAGARAEPLRVWLQDWQVEGRFPLRLRAEQDEVGIDLTLNPSKPLLLQGDQGLSQKSAEPGNASYYYTYTRLATQGMLRIGTRRESVSGASWLDREWGSGGLGPQQVGWDWFALQLSDRSELMFYRLRRRDGSSDPHSAGVWVAADGGAERLGAAEVTLRPLGWWESPRGGRYPAGWRLQVPRLGLEVNVAPYLADQELALSVRYWEGAVRVTGRRDGIPLTGEGYVELTGYAGAP